MGPILAFAYGAIAYLTFFGTILYAIGFTSGLAVPKDIDDGLSGSTVEALIINLALLTVFALQHSIMARKPFKRWWTQFVPAAVERSTYVLLSSLILIGLFWLWRPIPAIVWNVGEPTLAMALTGLCLFGWALVFLSTFLINHFELFGLQQVIHNLAGRSAAEPKFRTPFLYKLVRHPLYLGFIIAFWATPTMTVGHLLFAGVTTAYILVAIMLEERDLVDLFGDEYKRYRQRVAMLLPLWPKSS
ncbi:MAG: methanethiol S-methyltransferase [Hyphomicrobiaceae bacterium]|jgi:protein-S-isoprenylcysteine O-methyltransferase Ste14